MARVPKKRKQAKPPASPLAALLEQHLEALQVRNYSEHTVKNRQVHLGYFVDWYHLRGLSEPLEITQPVLEQYQRYLFYYRQKNGHPLTFRSQHARLVPVRMWFRWMARQRLILHNSASELEFPKLCYRLPKHVLTMQEAELASSEHLRPVCKHQHSFNYDCRENERKSASGCWPGNRDTRCLL